MRRLGGPRGCPNLSDQRPVTCRGGRCPRRACGEGHREAEPALPTPRPWAPGSRTWGQLSAAAATTRPAECCDRGWSGASGPRLLPRQPRDSQGPRSPPTQPPRQRPSIGTQRSASPTAAPPRPEALGPHTTLWPHTHPSPTRSRHHWPQRAHCLPVWCHPPQQSPTLSAEAPEPSPQPLHPQQTGLAEGPSQAGQQS